MKQSVFLTALIWAALEAGRLVVGDGAVRLIAYGAIALMALMIAGTFLWLWRERATPLALGMAWAWLGAGVLAGWWWRASLIGQGAAPEAGLHLVLAISLTGALLHFAVIQRSFGRHGASFLWPVALALALSGLAWLVA
ncbi:hypothetical protein [Sinisalibacter aestuarii]|uniref:Uncharacterized protein n=1 Tax=Sinisalibacter aestuarii TaxID=2949426 RepID=A0ABQ5LT66_9RHOB|nr:hypothetical protein [Sinisalibacter aestuarii]GKY87516.1 hypothetical protein STA1M1_13850 [Sinisalibacter aestuarii]